MRILILSALLSGLLAPSHAQLFSREALGGAAVGGILGGVIGHNTSDRAGEGAAIGAGAGLLLGAVAGEARREREARYNADYAPAGTVVYRSTRPNYAAAGAVVGGVAGGVIGHNQGRRTAEGVAIGAGAGLLAGGLLEYEARGREARAQAAAVPAGAFRRTAAIRTVPSETDRPESSQIFPAPPPAISYSSVGGSGNSMARANQLFGR